MNVVLMLAVAMTGQIQFRSCQSGASYQRQYVVAAPVVYHQPAYYYPKAQVQTAFIATELYEVPQVYGTLVGAGVRAENRRKEDQTTVNALVASVAGLTTAVRGLEARLGTAQPVVSVQPQPVAPGKPTPDVPGKPTPDVTPQPQPPPLPKTNPDNGDVPPPPPVPGVPSTGAGPGPGVEATAVFRSACLKCHQDPAKAGHGYVLFDKDGNFRQDVGVLDKISVGLETYTGSMPKNAPEPLDDKAISHLQAWIYSDPDAIRAFIRDARAKGLK